MLAPQPDSNSDQVEQYAALSTEELNRAIKEHTPGWSPEREVALKEAEQLISVLYSEGFSVRDSLADMLQAFIEQADGGYDDRTRISIDLLDVREGVTLVMTASGFSIRERDSEYLDMLEPKFFVERSISHDDIDVALKRAAGELIVALQAGRSVDEVFPYPVDPGTKSYGSFSPDSDLRLREAGIVDSLASISANRLDEFSAEIQFLDKLRELESSRVGLQLSAYLESSSTVVGGGLTQYLKIVELSPEVTLYYGDSGWKIAKEEELTQYFNKETRQVLYALAAPFSYPRPTALQGLNLDIEAVREALLGVCESLIASSS